MLPFPGKVLGSRERRLNICNDIVNGLPDSRFCAFCYGCFQFLSALDDYALRCFADLFILFVDSLKGRYRLGVGFGFCFLPRNSVFPRIAGDFPTDAVNVPKIRVRKRR